CPAPPRSRPAQRSPPQQRGQVSVRSNSPPQPPRYWPTDLRSLGAPEQVRRSPGSGSEVQVPELVGLIEAEPAEGRLRPPAALALTQIGASSPGPLVRPMQRKAQPLWK